MSGRGDPLELADEIERQAGGTSRRLAAVRLGGESPSAELPAPSGNSPAHRRAAPQGEERADTAQEMDRSAGAARGLQEGRAWRTYRDGPSYEPGEIRPVFSHDADDEFMLNPKMRIK